MFTTFGVITQPFIKATLEKINTIVLVLIVFMRQKEIRNIIEC